MSDTEQSLSTLISAAVAAKMTPEFIEKEVDTRVGKLIVESIDHALRSYSDTGKMIREAVDAALRVHRIDLPSYGTTVAAMVKAQIEANVAPIVAGKLAEDMEQLLGLAPKTVKLSEIAAQMIESRHSDGYGDVITVIVEYSDVASGYAHIYLDDEQVLDRRDKYRCKYHFAVNREGKIYSASIGDRDIKSTSHIGPDFGLGQKIRAYYAVGTVIEIDEDAVVTSVGDY